MVIIDLLIYRGTVQKVSKTDFLRQSFFVVFQVYLSLSI